MYRLLRTLMKKNLVLTIAATLAFVSLFVVPPDAAYAAYIDWRTLGLLFSLMAVMAGLQDIGFFAAVARKLLARAAGFRRTAFVLVFLCFFSSMLITNDVALITFVPFAVVVLRLAGREEALCPLIVLQTIAANLGSMLTPLGNPQNLYLYSQSALSLGAFLRLTAPYTAFAFLLLALVTYVRFAGTTAEAAADGQEAASTFRPVEATAPEMPSVRTARPLRRRLLCYALLFALCLAALFDVLPVPALVLITVIAVAADDPRLLRKPDYHLLATFIAFFIFVGNAARLPLFYHFLHRIIDGAEVWTAVAASQLISNVPAALLLSGFTDNLPALIIGTNIGGLGTLIASMASLISYKHLALTYPEYRYTYLKTFTGYNLVGLLLLALFAAVVPLPA